MTHPALRADAASTAPVLRALLPTLALDELAALLAGQARRLHRCTAATQDVLAALVSHAGWHSDRVWASEERLAAVARCSARTVRRALAWARQALGLRLLADPDELRRGPGPHEYDGARQGDGPVNCWDLAPLKALIPPALVALYRALEGGGQVRHLPVPRPRPAADPAAPFPDPFADPSEGPTPHPTPHSTPHPTPSCIVDGSAGGGGEAAAADEAPRPRKTAPPPPARRSPFPQTEMSPGTKKKQPARTDRAGLTDEEKAVVQALAAAGVSPVVARRMLADKGAPWCRQLLAYGKWQSAHERVGGGWYYRTWQAWVAWPDDFRRRRAREEAAARRAVRAPAAAAPERPAPSAPPTAGEGTAAPAEDPLAAALAALPEADRLALADQARAELRRDLPGAPHGLIDRLVPGRVRVLLQRRRGNGDGRPCAEPPEDGAPLPERKRPA